MLTTPGPSADSAGWMVNNELLQQIKAFHDGASLDLESIKSLLDSVQEKPYLIDPVLREVVALLADSQRTSHADPASAPASAATRSVQGYTVIYLLAKTRGAKIVSSFFPSEPQLLPDLLRQLEAEPTNWHVRYGMLLWLSVLVLIPFDFHSVGDNIFDRLFALATRYLVVSGVERDAAGTMLAKLLTRRPDPAGVLQFLQWAKTNQGVYATLGTLHALAQIAAKAPEETQEQLSETVQACLDRSSQAGAEKSAIKAVSRLALSNLSFVEESLGTALEGLGSESTGVRYTAAKAVARMAQKLDSDLQQQVVSGVLDIFDDNLLDSNVDLNVNSGSRLALVSDSQWHGALLAVAEMIRRQVPVPQAQVSRLLSSALFFEQNRVTYAIGQNVRDSACYVAWSLFRSGPLEQATLDSLYPQLTSLACFDREVNIRRAAAAALQEGLGRQSGLPIQQAFHLIEQLNFASVALVSRCYLQIAPSVNPPTDYLYHQIVSWDPSIRRLAAQSAALLRLDPVKVASMATDSDSLHGVLLALGAMKAPSEIVLPLLDRCTDYSSDLTCEAVLRALPTVDDDARITACLVSTSPFVVEATRDLLKNRKIDSEQQEWQQRMSQSSTFVAALASIGNQQALEAACNLADPQSRAYAAAALDANSSAFVERALNDYSVDKRGDVGSWVREAGLTWVLTHPNESKSLEPIIWRLAMEVLDRVRCKAFEAINLLAGVDLDNSFGSLLQEASVRSHVHAEFAAGYVKSVGAVRVNRSQVDMILQATTRFSDLAWLGTQILAMPLAYPMLRTLATLCERGVMVAPLPELTEVAIKGSLNTKAASRLIPSIDLLAVLALYEDKALHRLAKLLLHPLGTAREKAAVALFDAGVTTPALINTVWTTANPVAAKEVIASLG